MKLSLLLADLLSDARAHRGHTFAQPLRGGLTIHVKVTADDICHLAISRLDKPPSPEEWKTVIRDIGAPAGTPFVERQPEAHHRPYTRTPEETRVYLVGEWQMATELIEGWSVTT